MIDVLLYLVWSRLKVAIDFFFFFFSFPGGSDGKESARNAEDPGLIPGSGRSPGG